METLPKQFYYLLPVGMTLSWAGGISTACTVLQTLHLARDTPGTVVLMPQILKYMSPEVLSGGIVSFLTITGGIFGTALAVLSDRIGTKVALAGALALHALGCALTAWRAAYFLGLVVSATGSAASVPIFTALFTSQFDDERLTQKLVTYIYAFQNSSFLVATVAAGVQPFWMGWMECAVLVSTALAILLYVSGHLRDSADKVKSSAAQPSLRPNDFRVYGFAMLCSFTVIFWAIFLQYLGGAYMVFAQESLLPLCGFRIPAQWFLSLNGLFDLFVGVPMAWFYDLFNVRFHVKFRICFVLMALACGLLGLAERSAPMGSVSPLVFGASMILISLGELHYVPVMMAAISTEMPANLVGLFTGIYGVICGVGSVFSGAGLPLYKAVGSEIFSIILCSMACTGAIGLQILTPSLARCFDEASREEQLPLRVSKRHGV